MKKDPGYIIHHRVTSDNSIENLEWVPSLPANEDKSKPVKPRKGKQK